MLVSNSSARHDTTILDSCKDTLMSSNTAQMQQNRQKMIQSQQQTKRRRRFLPSRQSQNSIKILDQRSNMHQTTHSAGLNTRLSQSKQSVRQQNMRIEQESPLAKMIHVSMLLN